MKVCAASEGEFKIVLKIRRYSMKEYRSKFFFLFYITSLPLSILPKYLKIIPDKFILRFKFDAAFSCPRMRKI